MSAGLGPPRSGSKTDGGRKRVKKAYLAGLKPKFGRGGGVTHLFLRGEELNCRKQKQNGAAKAEVPRSKVPRSMTTS